MRRKNTVLKLHIRNVWKAAAMLVLLAAYIVLAYGLSRHQAYYDPYNLAGKDQISFEQAKVLSINSETVRNDEKHPELLVGSQNITVTLLTGALRGRSYRITNNLNYDTCYYLKARQTVIVSVSVTGDGKTFDINVNSPNRTPYLYLMAAIFAVLLCVIGGRNGFKSVIAIGFTITSVIFVFVPLLYRGVSPTVAVAIFAAVTACVTLLLVGGFAWKSFIAILGTVGGVVVSSVIALIFNALTGTSGYTFADTESLLAISSHSGLKVSSLFFAAVIISSLGAVMDVAISVASSVNEVYCKNPKAGGRGLFTSGMNVGRDMLGTMANTLILAFTGSSLVVLIQIYTYNMPYYQVMNSNQIAAEIIQALTGSCAVILTVPAVSFLSAKLLPLFAKNGTETGNSVPIHTA